MMRLAKEPIATPFPCTTAVGLASLGTGMLPGEHGVVGSRTLLDGHRFHHLDWRHEKEGLDEPDPLAVQGEATIAELMIAAGVPVDLVVAGKIKSVGYNQAMWRGTKTHLAGSIAEVVELTLGLAQMPGPRLIYAYTSALDHAAHLVGPGGSEYLEILGQVEQAVVRFRGELPADAVLLATADHGHMPINWDEVVYTRKIAELNRGVRWVGGDLRAAQVYTKTTTTEAVLERWRTYFGNTRYIATKAELIELGWFGPVITDRARAQLGDFMVIDKGQGGVAETPFREDHGTVSNHGAWSDAELWVPQIVLGQ
jgi:hypothetical protein